MTHQKLFKAPQKVMTIAYREHNHKKDEGHGKIESLQEDFELPHIFIAVL